MFVADEQVLENENENVNENDWEKYQPKHVEQLLQVGPLFRDVSRMVPSLHHQNLSATETETLKKYR